ncbi:MAG: right-handed parallel beta-helix repeat-containing protein [Candidatus Krumholzibacteria bacterium]|nr:right-handed parallel beta-helix repeat-containing protein [Candidatus Krumholzibacteria bacterium]
MTGKILTMSALLLVATWFLGSPDVAHAATLAVPADYSTINDAFEAARSGDRIEVAPGVYTEANLSLPNGVAFVGLGDGPGDVIIDGRGQGRILLAEGVDRATTIANFTFKNGRAAGHTSYERSGGAIFNSNSALRISNCIFLDNTSDGHGGAIRCNNSTPLITGCVFKGNAATGGGGGAIDCSFDSSPLVRGCQFENNSAAWGGALSCRGFSSPAVVASTFIANAAVGSKGYGGAVFADFGSEPTFQQSTYAQNTARYGGAIACLSDAQTNLENCTLTDNTAQMLGGGIFAYDSAPRINGTIIAFHEGTGISAEGGAAPVITCSDIFGNSRGDWVGSIASQLDVGNNINADPLFCDPTSGYSLMDESPASSPTLECGYMGAWPIGCDIVGTTVSTFAADWENLDAQLTWQVRSIGGSAPTFRLTGSLSESPATEWDVPFLDLGGGFYTAVDLNRNSGSGGTYIYRLYSAQAGGDWVLMDEINLISVPEFPGIGELKAWPNPFNPMTTISFRLGQSQRARISIYSPDGRRIAVLADRVFAAGLQSQTWDGRNSQGKAASSGTYIVLVEGEQQKQTQKVTLLK